MLLKFLFYLKVPAFESNDGKCLTDGNAISYYVANNQLRGGSDFDKAQVLQWMSFADNEVLQAAVPWVFPVMGIVQYNKNVSFSNLISCYYSHQRWIFAF